MRSMIVACVCLWLLGSAVFAVDAFGEPLPGDIYREYTWRPEGKWQRVTGPNVEDKRAKAFLPNAVNRIVIDDLKHARRAEACVEMLLCHAGTVGKKVRIGDGPWIDVPESALIPGASGQGPPDSEYQYMRYPLVDIPLDQLKEGENTFEFTCTNGTALGGWWPQWLLYGVTFRVYYDSQKPHPTGRIVSPVSGDVIGDRPTFAASANGPSPIRRVDFVGLYEDFNWAGDGNYRQWQCRYLFGKIHNHIGSATCCGAVSRPPHRSDSESREAVDGSGDPPTTDGWQVTWDTDWIPTQEKPIAVCARITDANGICFVTPAVEGLRLARPYSVRMYRPYDVPKRWATRAGKRHECKVDIDRDLAIATAAKIVMVTWNGEGAEEIGIGGKKVVDKIGKNHDLSHDEFPVPLEMLRPGTNLLHTFSRTEHHGIEVQWPGMVLMVRDSELEEVPSDREEDSSQQ